jgi:hypothetical protein
MLIGSSSTLVVSMTCNPTSRISHIVGTGGRHVYSNPFDPHVSEVLSLARFLHENPETQRIEFIPFKREL